MCHKNYYKQSIGPEKKEGMLNGEECGKSNRRKVSNKNRSVHFVVKLGLKCKPS